MARETHKQSKKSQKAESLTQLTFDDSASVDEASEVPQLPAATSKRWHKVVGIPLGMLALLALLGSGVLSQYFKGKVMPNVYVAGNPATAKTAAQIEKQLDDQVEQLKLSFVAEGKVLNPTFEQIGFQVDIEQTIKNTFTAKRSSGIFNKLSFWKKFDVPAVIKVNDTLLNQYLEANAPQYKKAPVDARLQFETKSQKFVVTPQADGQSPDIPKIKQQIYSLSHTLIPEVFDVGVAKRTPDITEAKLQPLVSAADALTKRKVMLIGLGYNYQAKPEEIAAWLTPTPQKDQTVKLVIDTAKIQSYVDSISKRISNAPTDRKILKDETSGVETVIQAGRDGTELADKDKLAKAITDDIAKGSDTTQTMNIQPAAYQTVNMNTYEKWIEVDISEQQTTAYERDKPIKNFTIASGRKGYETVIGDFAIWHKNRKQTMTGGSRANGDYYSTPNVEWVSYFYKDYALHGAWWQKTLGSPVSRGCVNMTNLDAKWIYEWAPVGTKVIVHA